MAALFAQVFEGNRSFRFRPILQSIFLLIIFSGVSLNLGQCYQYNQSYLHFAGMNKKAYWHIFGRYKLDGQQMGDLYRYVSMPDYEKLRSGEKRNQ
jgi:hypothetical protein